MNIFVIVLIISGNLRVIYDNLCFCKNHHRGAFLNTNDHKPLGRWPRAVAENGSPANRPKAVAISREKQ